MNFVVHLVCQMLIVETNCKSKETLILLIKQMLIQLNQKIQLVKVMKFSKSIQFLRLKTKKTYSVPYNLSSMGVLIQQNLMRNGTAGAK